MILLSIFITDPSPKSRHVPLKLANAVELGGIVNTEKDWDFKQEEVDDLEKW